MDVDQRMDRLMERHVEFFSSTRERLSRFERAAEESDKRLIARMANLTGRTPISDTMKRLGQIVISHEEGKS
jgi:hypothetical protein